MCQLLRLDLRLHEDERSAREVHDSKKTCTDATKAATEVADLVNIVPDNGPCCEICDHLAKITGKLERR